MRVLIVFLVLIILLTSGCAKKTAVSSEKDYWSQVEIVKQLPEIKLDSEDPGPRKMKILAEKVDVATAIVPPAGLEDYHQQLIKTVNLFYQASRISYMSGRNPAFKPAEAAGKLLAAQVEWEVLNNWFPPQSARRVSADEYFVAIERFFIDEQQPANKEFNTYITSDDATNEGIIERLLANNSFLEKEIRDLLNTIPPKKISYSRRDFLRVFLIDKQANDLYVAAMKAEDKDAAEQLTGLSTKRSNRADELLSAALEDLSAKTGHKNRWRLN